MPWTLHRHALYWDKPRAFMPERFPPGESRQDQPLPIPALRRRPRVCIGATFALQEAVIALAVMMHRFRFDLTRQDQSLAGAEADDAATRRAADARDQAIGLFLPLCS